MNTKTEQRARPRTRETTLVARGLKKSYANFEAVKGVDFEVYRGECFGFLGPNGAGKTTTMKMIYGAAVPTGGELRVAGLDVRRDEREVKRRIGVVPQENNLDEDLKVKENLLVFGRYFDLPRKLVRRRAEEPSRAPAPTNRCLFRAENLQSRNLNRTGCLTKHRIRTRMRTSSRRSGPAASVPERVR